MDQNASLWKHCLQHAARSDVGLRRGNNQDAMAVVLADSQQSWSERGHLFMVADGMGAHAAGELASKIATDVVPLTYHKLAELSPAEALLRAIHDANGSIYSRGQADPEFKGMGTTCTVLVLLPEGALVAHVGDSRAYRLRGDQFEQLTFDHSLVWELRQSGSVSDDVLPNYVSKNIITRSLGPNPQVRVDIEGPSPWEPGDVYLLCSDGLSGQVSDEEMGTVLASLPPDEAVDALVHLANLRGGPDNITVIVVRVTGPQEARGTSDETPRTQASAPPRPVHPLVWTLVGAFALGAGVLVVLQQALAALISLGAAAVAGLVALVQRYSAADPRFRFGARPLGRGPYQRVKIAPDDALVEQLQEMVEQAHKAALAEQGPVDWQRFDELTARARSAREASDYREAARQYLRAITLLIGQLKSLRGAASDRVIDL
jgi:serine/threonine protein phosphatase PrpC